MSPITTHVLDLSRGRPAAGLDVILERAHGGADWAELARGTTGADGRLTDLLPGAVGITAGTYRLRFATARYFAAQGARGFYPEVLVVFQVEEAADHYHIPLLLSPYGYSTYRGS
jgi:5-hydroxyisourate hydrolase